MKLKQALQSLARQAIRCLPIDVDDPTLDDKVALLEHRLRTVERKVLVRSVPKARAPTEQELLLLAMMCLLKDDQIRFLDKHRPAWRRLMADLEQVEAEFFDSGGLYHSKPGDPFPEVIPVRPA